MLEEVWTRYKKHRRSSASITFLVRSCVNCIQKNFNFWDILFFICARENEHLDLKLVMSKHEFFKCMDRNLVQNAMLSYKIFCSVTLTILRKKEADFKSQVIFWLWLEYTKIKPTFRYIEELIINVILFWMWIEDESESSDFSSNLSHIYLSLIRLCWHMVYNKTNRILRLI